MGTATAEALRVGILLLTIDFALVLFTAALKPLEENFEAIDQAMGAQCRKDMERKKNESMSQVAYCGSLRYRRAESKISLIDKQVPGRHAAKRLDKERSSSKPGQLFLRLNLDIPFY